jgi:uncharacterized phage infection (PIP) family protein YhgE
MSDRFAENMCNMFTKIDENIYEMSAMFKSDMIVMCKQINDQVKFEMSAMGERISDVNSEMSTIKFDIKNNNQDIKLEISTIKSDINNVTAMCVRSHEEVKSDMQANMESITVKLNNLEANLCHQFNGAIGRIKEDMSAVKPNWYM